MLFRHFVLPALCIVAGATSVTAGQFNRVLDIGDDAPRWTALPGVDGADHSFDQLRDADVMVVAFTCNSCPYAVDAEERLVALDRWLKERDGVLVAINVNKVAEDLLPEMRDRARERGFEFPYLFDASQEIAKRYGATTTPEFFVLDRDRKVIYMGSLDDSPDGKDVTESYVREAVLEVKAGTPVDRAETVPIGCRIRFDRSRRGER